MSEPCDLCGLPVNPHDLGVWKEVAGWVKSRTADGMTLRYDTGKYAHDACVKKAQAGQPPEQEQLL